MVVVEIVMWRILGDVVSWCFIFKILRYLERSVGYFEVLLIDAPLFEDIQHVALCGAIMRTSQSRV